jgi:hypothetical protein
MSQICAALLKANFRIFVTALTNRALIELAEKADGHALDSRTLEGAFPK